ncbi:MAG: MFS transporter [Gemmatimonadetes bacterium]|nr:MFS transporter [Gemmatimonadota bacterium]
MPVPPRPAALAPIAIATFLTLVPLTLLVPALTELVVDRHGGTRFHAHLFVALNQLAGIVAVPLAMRWHRRLGTTRGWVIALLAFDALAFLGMWRAESLGALFAWRALDGLAHLPALTFLMIAANRAGGARRGASLGLVATALMFGVGVGLPTGGILAARDPLLVYPVGMVLLGVAALAAIGVPSTAAALAAAGRVPEDAPPASRYRWDRSDLASWMPLAYGFADRFLIGVFSSSFTIFLAEQHGVGVRERGMLMGLFLLPFALLNWPAGRLADRFGWFRLIIIGNVGFGLVYATYGLLPLPWLPVAMVLSGTLSALMFSPSLVLVSEFARRGAGDGLFGAFQVAGSFGFLAGPVVGGLLVETLRDPAGAPRWAMIFASVGITLVVLGLVSARILRALDARWRREPA